MRVVPVTSTTLLRDVAGDAQHVRWGEFVARYRPMMGPICTNASRRWMPTTSFRRRCSR